MGHINIKDNNLGFITYKDQSNRLAGCVERNTSLPLLYADSFKSFVLIGGVER